MVRLSLLCAVFVGSFASGLWAAEPVLWLDASKADSLEVVDGKISVWRSRTGKNLTVVQTEAAARPTRQAALNDRGTLHFDGGDFFEGPSVLAEGDDTFTFIVLWRTDRAGAVQSVFEQAGRGTGRRAALLQVGDNYGFNGERNDAHALVPLTPGPWRLTGMVLNGRESKNVLLVDNEDEPRVATINRVRQNLGTDGIRIGRKLYGAEFLQGDLAEIRIYDVALSRAALRKELDDVQARWNVDFKSKASMVRAPKPTRKSEPKSEPQAAPAPRAEPAASPGPPSAPPTPDQVEYFETKIRPVLSDHCFRCHGEAAEKKGKLKAGLRLDRLAGLLRGGDSGPAIVPGQADSSLLVKAIRYGNEDTAMPPKAKLPQSAIDDLVEWVSMGAPWPGVDPRTLALADEAAYDWNAFRNEHWSFRPVETPEPPPVADTTWPQNAIDPFVLAQLEAKGLRPNPPAKKHLLLRRVYLDLIGLPPTPEQVRAFLDDTSDQAFAKVVDELLASPHYGERWARHWLDVARYSDGLGGFGDGAALPHAWRYRDWVVEAFNQDMPYNAFVRAQIAGDLLEDKVPVGTGFFAVGPTYKGDGGDPEATAQAKAETLSDRVDTLSRGFLGLTAACSRCHDHKFDPITIEDYYALAGIFNNTTIRNHPMASTEEVERYNQQLANLKQEEQSLKTWEEDGRETERRKRMRDSHTYLVAVDAFHRQRKDGEASKDKWVAAQSLDADRFNRWERHLTHPEGPKKYGWLKPWWDAMSSKRSTEWPEASVAEAAVSFQAHLDAVLDGLMEQDAAWRKAVAEAEAENGKLPARPKPGKAEDQLLANLGRHIYPVDLNQTLSDKERTEWERRRAAFEAVKKAMPSKFAEAHGIGESGSADMHVALRGDLRKKGEKVPRRFLQIIAGEDAPAYTSGSGRKELAASVVDPTNPLTPRVMVNRIWQWHLGEGLVRTPSNFGVLGESPSHPELLDHLASTFIAKGWSMKQLHREILLSATWQMSSQFDRGTFEVDGDNRLLWRMNPRKLGVESWRDSLLAATGELDRQRGGAPIESILGSPRRTLYAKISRNGDRFASDDFLRLFDFPAPRVSSPKRAVSTVPQQYLFMMNSDFMQARAKALSAKLAPLASDAERIHSAYQALYARPPSDREVQIGLAFLASDKPEKTWPAYAQVLLSAHEFLQIQ